MKNFAIKLVWFTTLFVFIFAGLCQTNIALPILTTIFLVGQILILFMVYKVLKDTYTNTKTFKEWYNDQPIETLDDKK